MTICAESDHSPDNTGPIQHYFDVEIIENPWHSKKLQWLHNPDIQERLLSWDFSYDEGLSPPDKTSLCWVSLAVISLLPMIILVSFLHPKELTPRKAIPLKITLSPTKRQTKPHNNSTTIPARTTTAKKTQESKPSRQTKELTASERQSTHGTPPQQATTNLKVPRKVKSTLSLSEQISTVVTTMADEEVVDSMPSSEDNTDSLKGLVFDSGLRKKLNSPEAAELNTRRVTQPGSYETVTGETVYFSKGGCTSVIKDPVIGEMWIPIKCPSRSKQISKFGRIISPKGKFTHTQ